MRRHVIFGRYGARDSGRFSLGEREVVTILELVGEGQALRYGIGTTISELAQIKVFASEIGIDLLVFALHVHAADTRISRSTESQDGWTREIRLIVPVSDLDRWNAASMTLARLLCFLTGDRWTLEFRARPRRFAHILRHRPAGSDGPAFDDLALFSGGLDSLIGAIDTLELGRTPLFVSHAGEGASSDAQYKLFDALKNHYRGRTFERFRVWLNFPKRFVAGSAIEETTRGRSFLFFALGALAGSGFNEPVVLKVPENGLIAVNVPFDTLRLGALSTRTTHPFYIARWNGVLATLGVKVRIENPYWDKTKGEMVSGCNNSKLLRRLVPASLSCASPTKGRWQGIGIQHCGYCVPCLIRRAALLTGLAPSPDPTSYTLEDLTARALSTRESEGTQIRSIQLAIERLRTRPELASLLVYKPGPLLDETPEHQATIAEVYRRGLAELSALLASVRTASG